MSNLEQARAEAAEHRAAFLKNHREACIALGKYCQAMEKAQALTRAEAIPNWGGNPELENKLAALLIKEPPIAAIKREGFEPVMGWGWNLGACDVIALVKKTFVEVA
jgi:hypothetical protein